jgi:pimeloyl-ACP methyl ester carboxylesterase
MTTATPDWILFAQHGWADNNRAIGALTASLTTPDTVVIAPSLGYIKTWLRIEPLIQAVEAIATQALSSYPDAPMRIIGHSMGGLIWLEVLDRHPEWGSRVDSLVLLGSPIGGSDLGRILDPFNLGLGIARDLGKNRRPIAEAIAAHIPTLVIAGDVDSGSDGTIPVESTKVFGAEFVYLAGLSHPTLRNHALVANAIRQFWATHPSRSQPVRSTDLSDLLIQRFRQVTGITDAHYRGFYRAQVQATFKDGVTLRVWKNSIGIDHVFVACPKGQCVYGGFVGWGDAEALQQVLAEVQQEHADALVG